MIPSAGQVSGAVSARPHLCLCPCAEPHDPADRPRFAAGAGGRLSWRCRAAARVNNGAMHSALTAHGGFVRDGSEYPSERSRVPLCLFARRGLAK